MSDIDPASDQIDQLVRSLKWSALVGAAGLLVFVLSLGFGAYYLNQLSDEIEARQESIDSLDTEIDSKWRRIDQLREKGDSLQKIIASRQEAAHTTEQRPTAWIQVATEEQREAARKMGALLKQEGFGKFRVPGIETVERLPNNKQIRVFNSADMDLARRVRNSLAEEGFVFKVRDLSSRYDVESGVLEFWFSSPG